MAVPIDRTLPLYRDDPVIARLTDEQVWALAELVARMAVSYARRLEAAGVAIEDVPARIAADANGWRPRRSLDLSTPTAPARRRPRASHPVPAAVPDEARSG